MRKTASALADNCERSTRNEILVSGEGFWGGRGSIGGAGIWAGKQREGEIIKEPEN